MDKKYFNKISRIVAIVIFVIASFTYLSTIEPTASFWDCGEFIASSYKLEVGHPPGNPVYQIIARFFTLFANGKEHVAAAINGMNALISALTIFFLYLTIVHLGRRILETKGKNVYAPGYAVGIIASGIVGALVYCWSDTFWFSAVEGEVYSMSSFFTAIVFWAMLKWEEEAENKYANRWIVLIALLMGLSIGVHLLNLLTIPALAFIYYYKTTKKEVTFWKGFGVLCISFVILALVLFGIIPFLPKIAAMFDLLFVNGLGLHYNSGALFFMTALLVTCFYFIYRTFKKKKALANTIWLCFTMITIGYSAFAMIIIRSSINPPTNEYQPDNPFTLVRYLGREQYGSNPLVYGETFASVPSDYNNPHYYTPLNGKYYKAKGPLDVTYPASGKMLFPRMWSRQPQHIKIYQQYMSNKGKVLPNGQYRMPTMGDNLSFFFNFQVNWMYMRYFMWNFVGRQNDLASPTPGNLLKGNWESGIKFIDQARLGDQTGGPDYIANSRAKNHYFFLPLILGLIGLFFQLNTDNKNWWITFLLFFFTGFAVVLYLNQPPLQVRERDYAYAGSFYAFSIWVGLGVLSIINFVEKKVLKGKEMPAMLACIIGAVTLLIPIQMVGQNWNDHDRSGRYTCRDLAYNYFASCDKNAILITQGDNDTFPLWYLQEVEEIRPDIRIMNTSLMGTDWYLDQMKCKINQSDPIPFTLPRKDYLYGTNEYVDVTNAIKDPITVEQAINFFKSDDPRSKVNKYGNESLDYIPSKHLRIPVNVENVKKYGIVAPEDYDKILDTLDIVYSKDKNNLTKPELMMLDLFAHYNWDRPIYFVSMGGDMNVGEKNYLQFDGLAYKLVPIKSVTHTTDASQIVSSEMYKKVMKDFRWDSISDTTINFDYQNLATFNGVMNVRSIFVQTAKSLVLDGEKDKAIEVLDRMQEVTPEKNLPLNTSIIYSVNEYMVIQAIDTYFKAGEQDKGLELANKFADETINAIQFFARPYKDGYLSKSDVESNISLLYYEIETLKNNGMKKTGNEIETRLKSLLSE
ncbi:MAG: DUF2723 domain-containing protein [Bacteroidales bacterium]